MSCSCRCAQQPASYSPPPAYSSQSRAAQTETAPETASSSPSTPHRGIDKHLTWINTPWMRVFVPRALFLVLCALCLAFYALYLTFGALYRLVAAPSPDVYWALPLVPEADCMGYGMRAYTATLVIEPASGGSMHASAAPRVDEPASSGWIVESVPNALGNKPVPDGWHRMCMNDAPAVEVTGKVLKRPTWCDMREDHTIVGHWVVDYGEPECVSSWGWFTDKGCTAEGSGLRTFESDLHGRLDAGAWRDMCRRTPAIVRGVKFLGAMRCYNRDDEGIWGAWDIEDKSCAS
ncbi:uncharacterized protein SCHCODRAFT_02630138 [Schizophyllum commune H4-8]|uniref:Uncharacterized protein n=1 Tax=Schizophyllum commune (strain H4-8 / FGSC 9210) TaxID=578458 RepID=D8Q6Q5_SCHCM|nr:uncharacterized protein SCHCODRAFT_02630138 [Schizophyllum commune H4-8]KAI5891829.1 hypothetical protein SCHCODRAFT_02630138 [Schizophyllum commune H4-8]